jgi:CarD family transcriptional regulator
MFELKDKVVYPGHGVAVIEEIIEKSVAGTSIKFFKLNFLFKDMTILLPVHNLSYSGVRFAGDKKTVELALNELYKLPAKKMEYFDFTPSGWNKRNKDYQNKIQSGTLIEIAQIYRDLMFIAQHKELSFGEKTILQVVEELFVQEIQLITNQDRPSIIDDLHNPFKQIFFGAEDPFAQDSTTIPQSLEKPHRVSSAL